MLRLVERQAGAAIPAGDRDFTGYIANVVFDDWDEVWTDAVRAGGAAGPLCARIRRWLQPVWGLPLPPSDYAHNDLNLSNILTDGDQVTGVVDWDEFGLGSRAFDLVVLALDCQERGAHAAADRLLASAASAVGGAGLRCLASLPRPGRARREHQGGPGIARGDPGDRGRAGQTARARKRAPGN